MGEPTEIEFGGIKFIRTSTLLKWPHQWVYATPAEWSTLTAAVHRAEAAEEDAEKWAGQANDLEEEVARLRELVNEIDGICTDTFTDPNDLIEQAITRHRAWEAKRG